MSEAKRRARAYRDDAAIERIQRQDKAAMMDLRIRMLLRNGLTSKSGVTLADTDVLKELALRLGYDLKALEELDPGDPAVNPYAKR